MDNTIHNPSAVSPISPRLKNSNPIFFSGGSNGPIADTVGRIMKGTTPITNRSQSRSPSPDKGKSNISITIDHVEDHHKEQLDPEPGNAVRGRRTSHSPGQNNSKNQIGNGNDNKVNDPDNGGVARKGASRRSRKDNHDISTAFRKRYIGYMGRYYEPDRDLIRRQQAMIAVQPMTGLEKIDYQRDVLRMKVENRKRAETFMTPRSGAMTNLGTLGSSKSQPGSRSPSRSPSRLFMDKAQSDFDISKKLADSTSHAVRVTKKVSNLKGKLTPKINQKAVVSKKVYSNHFLAPSIQRFCTYYKQ